MEFFRLGYNHTKEIVAANNRFEAFGFFVDKHMADIAYPEDVLLEEQSASEPIEVFCVGFPVNKTVFEIYGEGLEQGYVVPFTVCGIE